MVLRCFRLVVVLTLTGFLFGIVAAATLTNARRSLEAKPAIRRIHPDVELARERQRLHKRSLSEGPDASVSCAGEFERCAATLDCVLISSFCGRCRAGEYLCPDVKTCVAEFHRCPNLDGTIWDWKMSIDHRLELLANLTTPDEQSAQLSYLAPSIERLYVPAYNWLNDDLHGLRRHRGTSFPNGNGLGATWSVETLAEVGKAIGDEARAEHHFYTQQGQRGMIGYHNGMGMTIYAPNINLVRDPRWGRAQEVYSEDPCLTSDLAIGYVQGMQTRENGYMQAGACCKHYAVYDVENFPTARYFYNAVTDGRNLWETYLPAFEACTKEAGGSHVMCSYNAINGVPACAQKPLLDDVLRGRWNWTGFVVSDYDAWAQITSTHKYCPNMTCAAAVGINAGMDQEGGGESAIDELPAAMKAGLVTAARVRQAFVRNFRLRFELGMFDPPEFVPFSAVPYSHLQSSKHQQLALRAARESIGMYKNDGVLPLQPPTIASASPLKIAVVGPKAASTAWLQGNYAVYPTHGVVSILEAVSNANCGKPNTCNMDAPGIAYNVANDSFVEVPTPSECCSACNGDLSCNYWTFREGKCYMMGNSFAVSVLPDTRVQSGARFGLCLMVAGVSYVGANDVSVPSQDSRECCQRCRADPACDRWTFAGILNLCYLSPTGPATINDDCISGNSSTKVPSVVFAPGCTDGELCQNTSGFDAAVRAAAQADVVVMVVGLGQSIESEGNDRKTIDLPENLYTLSTQVRSSAKKIVTVLVHGGTIAFKNVHNDSNALLDAWYPSQQGGNAIADVLFGFYSPASRATVTYYHSNDDLPPNLAQQNLYHNGTYQGLTYRYFQGNPTVPFGFGLTYTSFVYRNMTVSTTNVTAVCESITVTVDVTNVGSTFTSDEVVQVYVSQQTDTPAPQNRLAAFTRIRDMQPGETRKVTLVVRPKYRSIVNQSLSDPILGSRVETEVGQITVSVGGGQQGFTPGVLFTTVQVSAAGDVMNC